MKRIICFVLCVLLSLSIFSGCQGKEEADPLAGVFSVGYAKVDITPSEPVRLAGFSSNEERESKSVMDPIYATCVAFTDEEGTTVLMFGLDMLNTAEKAAEDIRDRITEVIDIPRDNILFSATHTHSSMSPKTTGIAGEEFRNGCLEAARQLWRTGSPPKCMPASAARRI